MNTRNKAAMAAASAALAVVLSAEAALAKDVPGTPRGEVLRGTERADTIWGYGGADLIYGLGGADFVWAGNEAGTGDKVLGGPGNDGLVGQRGHDALYGGLGDDHLEGHRGDDLLVGKAGEDVLIGGPGADEVDARDGQKDTIAVRFGEGDVVHYDRGLDVLEAPAGEEGALSAAEAIGSGKVKLVAQDPLEGVFGHTGKVLVEHDGEELTARVREGGRGAHGPRRRGTRPDRARRGRGRPALGPTHVGPEFPKRRPGPRTGPRRLRSEAIGTALDVTRRKRKGEEMERITATTRRTIAPLLAVLALVLAMVPTVAAPALAQAAADQY